MDDNHIQCLGYGLDCTCIFIASMIHLGYAFSFI